MSVIAPDQQRRGLQEVKVEKDELLKIVSENQKKSADEYEQAMEGFHRRQLEEAEALLTRVQTGQGYKPVQLPEPRDNHANYERVVKMLEMEQDDVLIITSQEFSQYVMDEWSWAVESRTTNFGMGYVSDHGSMPGSSPGVIS